jgi:hypothetical protein
MSLLSTPPDDCAQLGPTPWNTLRAGQLEELKVAFLLPSFLFWQFHRILDGPSLYCMAKEDIVTEAGRYE